MYIDEFSKFGFLFALAAVLIPIIVHLFHFRKFKKIFFTNVAFLTTVKVQNASREKLKNRLILLSRVLAISFLVFAFAQPVYSPEKDSMQKTDNLVSIYIDNSFSMGAISTTGTLLDEAKLRAMEIVKSYPINSRFQLLTNDFEGKHQRFLDTDAFKLVLDEVKISSSSRKLQQVVNRLESTSTVNSNHRFYILSDFQTNFSGTSTVKLKPQRSVYLVKLTAKASSNLSIDSVWFTSPTHLVNNTEQLVVRMRNFGTDDAKDIPLKLEINQQQKAVLSIDVKANSSRIDTLKFGGLKTGWQKATLQLKDYPFTFDDKLYFAFNVKSQQSILCINGENAPNTLKALYSADTYFRLTEMAENTINYSQLPQFSLVVLNGLSQASSGLIQTLRNYLGAGGNLVVFPNTQSGEANIDRLLNGVGLSAHATLNYDSLKVTDIVYKNTIFKDVFLETPHQTAMPAIYRHYSFQLNKQSIYEPLLLLPFNNFLFARFAIGSGVVYLAATGLGNQDGNWARHPVFLPMMYKIAFGSQKDFPLYYPFSSKQSVEIPWLRLQKNQTLNVVSKGYKIIPEIQQSIGKTRLFLADQIKTSGHYEVNQGDSTLAIIAFNEDRTESLLQYDTEQNLRTKMPQNGVHLIDAENQHLTNLASLENNSVEFWKLCLILSLAFILAEILLVRFFNPTKIQ